MVSDTGSTPEPQIKRGVLLPRVGAVPGVEQLSPTATVVPLPQVEDEPALDEPALDEPALDGPRHRRSGGPPRRLALAGGLCAVALVVVVCAVALTRPGSGSGKADDQGPAALNQAPPVPSRTADVRQPQAPASARLTPSPAHSASPRSSASARRGAPSTAAHHWQSLVVHATYVLNPGDSVHSNRISLSLLTDGDLVLRDEHGRVTWSTGTHARGARAVFQADGNFVVYQGDQPVWSSRTDGHDGATLVLQADGAMRILYGNAALWTTGTG
jgi:hypothetical protein